MEIHTPELPEGEIEYFDTVELTAKGLTKYVTDKAIALIKALHNPPIGAKEFSGGWCPERCDALLFTSSNSFLIETKISRSDFLSDFKKPHRQEGAGLIGNYRYYACPTGLIKPEELPPKWGLIYVDEKKSVRASMPVGFGGYIRTPRNDYRHPIHGWKEETYQAFGSKTYNNEELEELFGDGSLGWKHPEQPRNKFRFEDTGLERNYLFALATRYKSQKFMENIL